MADSKISGLADGSPAEAGDDVPVSRTDDVATRKVTAQSIADLRTIADDEITYAKIQDVTATDRLLGRDTAGSGVIEEITVGGGVEFTGSGGIQRSALTGDVTANAGNNTTTIANDAVTYAKMQNVSATDRLLGRDTASAGDVEELTVGGGLEFTGSGGIQRSALTGDVTASAGSGSTTIANDAVTTAKILNSNVTTAKIADANVTYAKIQNVTDARLLGRSSGSAGPPIEITVGSGLSLAAGALTATGSGGGPTFFRMSSDHAIVDSTTVTDVTGMSFSASVSTVYAFEMILWYTTDSAGEGIRIAFTGPASPTAIYYSISTNSSATAQFQSVATAFGTDIVVTAAQTGTNIAMIHGTLINGSNSGTVQLRHANETAATSTTTILTGSWGWSISIA